MDVEAKNMNTCKTCKHFRQHYVQFGRRYGEVYCGHCVHPRLKSRLPDTPACKHFAEREQAKKNK